MCLQSPLSIMSRLRLACNINRHATLIMRSLTFIGNANVDVIYDVTARLTRNPASMIRLIKTQAFNNIVVW